MLSVNALCLFARYILNMCPALLHERYNNKLPLPEPSDTSLAHHCTALTASSCYLNVYSTSRFCVHRSCC